MPIATFLRQRSKHQGFCLFPTPMDFPLGKMKDAESFPSKETQQYPLSHLPAGQIANSTKWQSEQLSLGVSPLLETETDQCGYSTSYSPLSL